MARYGMHLGTAFQLVDDVLDYSGEEAATGKHLGDDLAEGKPTLPLIHAMHGTAEQAALRARCDRTGRTATACPACWRRSAPAARWTPRAPCRG
jgi:octaprenyl-diphosphate synthase